MERVPYPTMALSKKMMSFIGGIIMTKERNSMFNQMCNQRNSYPTYPTDLLQSWFHSKGQQLLSGTLSMVDRHGCIRTRTHIIESIDASGNLYIAMNADSFWMDLSKSQSFANLSFYNSNTNLQVNIEGKIRIMRVEESVRNFLKQPVGVQAYSIVSKYPKPLLSRMEANTKFEWWKQEIENQRPEVNPNWTLYMIEPHYFEFIVGSRNEMPECMVYQKIEGVWNHQFEWI